MSKKKIEKEITDSDIDELFNNNNSSVLQSDIKTIDVPEELSIENDKKSNYIDRPRNPKSENVKIKEEIKKLKDEIDKKIQEDINSIKELSGFEQARRYIKKLISLKNEQKINQEKTKAILAGLIKPNFDPGSECTFHIYRPRDILGNKIYCACKFCSTEKIFTNQEWDEYCIKYRKWF